jgi:hypothetical protein
MLTDIEFVHSSSNLRALTNLLNEWKALVKSYHKTTKEDVCWIYNERATLSVLAGAAWRLGWIALEEYSTEKLAPSESEGPLKANGRCDLWLSHGKRSFAIEAKQSWQSIGRQVKSQNKWAKRKYTAAFKDAGRLIRAEADSRLAMLFIAPSFPAREIENTGAAGATALINDWLETLPRDFKQIGAMAYIFPKETRCFDLNGRIYPGVVLLVRQRLKREQRR